MSGDLKLFPFVPNILGNYDTVDYAYGVAVVGDYAFVPDYGSGLEVIEVSNPTTPALHSHYDTPGFAYSVTESGHYAFVADGGSGLQAIQVS